MKVGAIAGVLLKDAAARECEAAIVDREEGVIRANSDVRDESAVALIQVSVGLAVRARARQETGEDLASLVSFENQVDIADCAVWSWMRSS